MNQGVRTPAAFFLSQVSFSQSGPLSTGCAEGTEKALRSRVVVGGGNRQSAREHSCVCVNRGKRLGLRVRVPVCVLCVCNREKSLFESVFQHNPTSKPLSLHEAISCQSEGVLGGKGEGKYENNETKKERVSKAKEWHPREKGTNPTCKRHTHLWPKKGCFVGRLPSFVCVCWGVWFPSVCVARVSVSRERKGDWRNKRAQHQQKDLIQSKLRGGTFVCEGFSEGV